MQAAVLPPALCYVDIMQVKPRSLLTHERKDLLCMFTIIFHKIDAVWRSRGAYTLAFERSQAAIDCSNRAQEFFERLDDRG
jgi:hypothetical protein